VSHRSPYRVSYISEVFWAFVNIIGLFFSTIFGDARQKVSETSNGRSAPSFRHGGGGGGDGSGGGGGRDPRGGNIRGFADLKRGSGSVPGGCSSCAGN